FQAEDGIRDRNVTGVQTCALPIFLGIGTYPSRSTRRKNSEHPTALTATAKEELARVPVTRLSERLAEVVGILRFGGGLQLLPGRLIIETGLDHEGAAHRLRSTLHES